MDVTNQGYYAFNLWEVHDEKEEEEYLELLEASISDNFNITSYELIQARSNESKVSERFQFEVDNITDESMVYLNPFFVKFFERNPFLLEKRNYPIDFGYPRKLRYQIIMTLPKNYSIEELPESKIFTIGEQLASLKLYTKQLQNQLSIMLEFDLKATHFSEKDYAVVKEMFRQVVDLQKNTILVLKKEQ